MRKIIVLDPGHGGSEPGATGQGLKEKDLTLSMALDVGRILEKHLIDIVFTRTTDENVSLSNRANIANNNKADYFVSFHINSAASSQAYGQEIFSYPNENTGFRFSVAMLNEIDKQKLITRNRGNKTANFAVLRETKMPAVLIEYGFIKNKLDMTFLLNNWEKIIQAMAKAIIEHIGIEYIPHDTDYVKDKIVLNIASERVLLEQYNKNGLNYINISGVKLPVRLVLKEMGFIVDYYNNEIYADLSKDYKPEGENIGILFLGNKIYVNGFFEDGTNFIKIDKGYYSIRSIMKPLNLNVCWNEIEKLVTVYK